MVAKQTRAKSTPPGMSMAFGLSLEGWLLSALPRAKATGKTRAHVVFIGQGQAIEAALAALDLSLPPWLLERARGKGGEMLYAATEAGPLWLLMAQAKSSGAAHDGLFRVSPYGVARDLAAQVVAALAESGLAEVNWHFSAASEAEQRGALVGLELGAYRFKQRRGAKPVLDLPRLILHGVPGAILEAAHVLGVATNLARHLVNLPPNELNPTTYSEGLQELFGAYPAMTVSVWQGKKLVQERMGLLLGVGQAAAAGPALVHLKYRPKKIAKGVKPLAFVGKGITFDSGGLDIKDAGGMRLMKKDMGGSASLTGLAYWLAASDAAFPCDIYLALAENAVDQHSFRPGDILTARNGLTIEIDNTDAEGRLVLADALDVAVAATGADAPAAVINLATLTGAMRVALGLRIAGLFANDDDLARALLLSGQRTAEPAWRMPLYADYFIGMRSNFADFANAAPGGRGGAITAALFLQKFVREVPWAHFDMMAWSEGNTGGCIEAGGNGQCVQLLADFLASR